MPLYDYECEAGHVFEIRCLYENKPLNPSCECGLPSKFIITSMPHLCTVIVPMYPGAKRVKAGYVHSHADMPGTKVSSGVGGMIRPKETPQWVKDIAQPDPANSVKRKYKENGQG